MVFFSLLVRFSIRIVADFGSNILQFTTKFYADYNVHFYHNLGYYFYTLCVASMGIWYLRYQIIPEGVSPLQASW
jgi:hypothetical protein